MRINGKDVLKKMRIEANMSQEDLAGRLFIDARTYRGYESGKRDMDIWQFAAMSEALGYPIEDFWQLYLDTNEYEEYRIYKHLKRLLRDRQISKVRELLPTLENGVLTKQPFMRQFIARAKVKVDKDIPNDEAIEKLLKAMHMSNPKFDEHKIADYRLTYNEVNIIIDLAGRLFESGEEDRAISMVKAVIGSRNNSRTSEEDRASLFPVLMSNLSTMLGRAGRHKESLDVSNEAIEICREYNNLRFLPKILYNIACSYLRIGEEEWIYRPHLVRAYHCAYAMGDIYGAKIIEKDAKKDFGISLP